MPKRRGRAFGKTRWLVQKDGRDLGPYAPLEIRELLLKGQITSNTLVRESAHRDWHPVRDVRAFLEYVREIRDEREQQEKDRALDAEESRVRSRRRAPRILLMLAFLGLLAVAGWYGWSLWESREALSGSGYSDRLYVNLELDRLPERAWIRTGDKVDWADEKVTVRKVVNKEKKKPGKTRAAAGGSKPATGVVRTHNDLGKCPRSGGMLSFDGASEGGRALTSSEVNRVTSRATQKLIGCAQKEAERTPTFPGTTVCFTIKPSGSLGGVRFGSNGARSSRFTGCARSALRKLSVAPFDPMSSDIGTTVRIPLRVGR